MINSTLNGIAYYAKLIVSGAVGGYLKHTLGYGKKRNMRTDIVSGIILSVFLYPITRYIGDLKTVASFFVDAPFYRSATEIETVDIITGFLLGLFGVSAFDILADVIHDYIVNRKKHKPDE